MKQFVKIVLFFFLSLGFYCIKLNAKPDSAQTPVKILFIGSSYFNFNDLPTLFKNLAYSSGKEVYIDRAILNGLYLEDHANLNTTETKIREQDWDYVILQGVGSLTAYPNYYTSHPVYPALLKLREKIKSNNEQTKMVFCLPWAYEDGMIWIPGWTDTYEDMQIKIYENTLKYSDEIGFMIAPVGWAWYSVLKEKNYPLHYLHLSDWNHPSLKGSYLMACVIYSTVYLESSEKNTFYSELEQEEAEYYQTIATNTVMDSLSLWKIIPTNSNDLNFTEHGNLHLYQNKPNPFRSFTNIQYDIPQNSFVEISVLDISGKKLIVVLNEYQKAGNHSLIFDGNGLKSGVYFYRIKINHQIEMKKMYLIR